MVVEVRVVNVKVRFDRTHEEWVLAFRLCWSDVGWNSHGGYVRLVGNVVFFITRIILRTIQISFDTTCVHCRMTCITDHMACIISHTTRILNRQLLHSLVVLIHNRMTRAL